METEDCEWKTTWSPAGIVDPNGFHPHPGKPKQPPPGYGWDLRAMAVADGIIYWAWRRPGIHERAAARKKRKR